MKEKKHIDRLFQERFKDFEAAPDDAVWKKIEAQLKEKKKKRRVIPIWWRYAGVAALLLLLITIGSLNFNTNKDILSPQVVDTKNTESEKIKEKKSQDLNTPTQDENYKATISNIEKNNKEVNTSKKNSYNATSKTSEFTENPALIANSKKAEKSVNRNEKQRSYSQQNAHKSNDRITQKNTNALAVNSNKNIQGVTNQNNPNTIKKEAVITNEALNKENQVIAKKITTTKSAIEIAKNNDKEAIKAIEDAIEKNKSLTQEEKEDENSPNLNKWSVAPNVAPVYFSSLGQGSSIDSQFNNNSRDGEVNMSYGLSASYAINNKLSIRSGVHKVNLSYNTNDVVVFRSLVNRSSALALENVNSDTNNASNQDAIAEGDITIISANSFNTRKSASSIITDNSKINQSFGYIEVPLEIQYAISNKKFGINLIGGFSSLFLSNNTLSTELEGATVQISEADNINKVSYSANLGLGLNYKISKKINLNLEPMFKYQINTFSNTSGDLQPFFIGVYTGFGIKF